MPKFLYILLFPFCSPHLVEKKWPFFNELITTISNNFIDKYKILVAPGPNEINEAKNINATSILYKNKAINICQLASLIKDSSFVISNDTGPAHMAAHLGAKGITLFGSHTTAHKVSIERQNFKAIQVNDLKKLSVERVFERLKEYLN